MTPDQIQLVQTSFDRVFPHREALAETFYGELFRSTPSVRPYFPTDMSEQRIKLVDTLAYVVRNLDRPELIEETVLGLARRHVRYGAKPEHFGPVGMALVHALNETMPGEMTAEEGVAWLLAFSFVSDMMVAEIQRSDAA